MSRLPPKPRRWGKMHRITALAFTTAIAGLPAAPLEAYAAGPQQQPRAAGYSATPSACLRGEVGPDWDVASVNETGTDNKYLYCGSGATGVLHIDGGAHPHPIDESGADDDNVVNCVMNFGSYGHDGGEDRNNYRMYMRLLNGQTAWLHYDKESYNVVTVYTTGTAEGNDWNQCGNYPTS